MTRELTALTVDLGAESGRVMAVHYNGAGLRVEELHRFANCPVSVRGRLHWDVLGLWREVQLGIKKGIPLHPASLGVDTWGVDFALLDSGGDLLGNPICYRDSRTDGMMERVFARVPRAEVFETTGIQFSQINTLYQLMSLVVSESPQLEAARTFLTVPDLLNFWLTGVKASEFSIASTTQMLGVGSGSWAAGMLERLGIPTDMLPEVVPAGTRLGEHQGVPVIAPACHDTGSAVAAIPAQGGRFGYISSGTWSLAGLEVKKAIVNEQALQANVTNEGGVYGTYRLLKNIVGLWIVQQCRATWRAAGQAFGYDDLVGLAQAAEPFAALIDPDDPVFLSPGDHPERLRAWCRAHGEAVPGTVGGLVRSVLESLALQYRQTFEALAGLTDQTPETIHIVGGGSRNDLLNQFTADATGCLVLAGPVEATVLGNALVQLIALGELRDLAEGRRVVAAAGGLKRFEPRHRPAWDAAYERFLNL
jgi:rhamnulokinase